MQPADRRAAVRLPSCGTILLLGSGGRAFWENLKRRGPALGEPAPDYHPIHDYCASAAKRMMTWLSGLGIRSVASYPDDSPALNFMHLAEMAGWGTISPVVGILLHPEFGPWVSLRVALLLEGEPLGSIEVESQRSHQVFQPCLRCVAPCVDACPAQVFDGKGGVDFEACTRHRHAGHCRDGCESRRSCTVGVDSRYSVEEESFRHAYSQYAMREHLGTP